MPHIAGKATEPQDFPWVTFGGERSQRSWRPLPTKLMRLIASGRRQVLVNSRTNDGVSYSLSWSAVVMRRGSDRALRSAGRFRRA